YFEQDCNRLVFSRSLLDRPMLRQDPLLFQLILAEFKKLETVTSHQVDIISAAQYHIERQLRESDCTLEHVAAACDFAPWTLKRRLHDLGTNFQQLVADTRHMMALRYLVDHQMSVTETAFALGYSEVSAFSRA